MDPGIRNIGMWWRWCDTQTGCENRTSARDTGMEMFSHQITQNKKISTCKKPFSLTRKCARRIPLLVLDIQDQYCFPKTRYLHLPHCFRIQIGMFRPIRVDHTNCLQVVIKTHSFEKLPLLFFLFDLIRGLEVELPREKDHWSCRVIPQNWSSRKSPSPLYFTPSRAQRLPWLAKFHFWQWM
jgi:hypothetical protein